MQKNSMLIKKQAKYKGSLLLKSSKHRVLRVFPVVLFLWLLSGWAMGWW